ncbi:MAG: 1-(5-phosphoribosyl)-5-[(5-phosphoribosylamino)methylideneamino]imidazole-4-carboxamide isomerase [Polyangiaceae bacterium]
MHIWPAIDLLGGAAVRLHQGRYDEVTVFDRDPTAVATRWSGKTPRLHVVDLEGAREGRPIQTEAIRSLVESFKGEIEVGGGIRTLDSALELFDLGVSRVVLGTAAVRDPNLVSSLASRFPKRVVLALDARDGKVATDGWTEVSTRDAVDVAQEFSSFPLAAILYTDIARDGTRVGPNLEAISRISSATSTPVLASGGVGSLDDLRALSVISNVVGAIVGRALYDGVFSVEDARRAAGDL